MKNLKKKSASPEVRAAKRLRQAERREAAYEAGDLRGMMTVGREENLNRIARLKAGTWPKVAGHAAALPAEGGVKEGVK